MSRKKSKTTQRQSLESLDVRVFIGLLGMLLLGAGLSLVPWPPSHDETVDLVLWSVDVPQLPRSPT